MLLCESTLLWSLWLWKIAESAFSRIDKITSLPLNSGQCFPPALPPAWFLCLPNPAATFHGQTVPAPALCSWAQPPHWAKSLCKSWEFAGTGVERSCPVKVALNKRKGLCFSARFIRKTLEPLCPLCCRRLWDTYRTGHWESCSEPQLRVLVYSSSPCRSRWLEGAKELHCIYQNLSSQMFWGNALGETDLKTGIALLGLSLCWVVWAAGIRGQGHVSHRGEDNTILQVSFLEHDSALPYSTGVYIYKTFFFLAWPFLLELFCSICFLRWVSVCVFFKY